MAHGASINIPSQSGVTPLEKAYGNEPLKAKLINAAKDRVGVDTVELKHHDVSVSSEDHTMSISEVCFDLHNTIHNVSSFTRAYFETVE